jgi:FkbM family methyltransferase
MESFTTNIGKYKIHYYSGKEFHTLKREIFTEKIYDFLFDSESPLILDIGANIGLSVIYFKSICPNSKVIAFEPNPYTFDLLERNVFENRLEGVTLVNKAISTENGRKKLYIDSSENLNYSTSSFLQGAWDKSERTQESLEVECISLSGLVNEYIDLTKIDVEGYEYQLLSNSKSALSYIDNLLIEYHPVKKGTLKKLVNLLRSAGYGIDVYRDGKLVNDFKDDSLLILKCSKDARTF